MLILSVFLLFSSLSGTLTKYRPQSHIKNALTVTEQEANLPEVNYVHIVCLDYIERYLLNHPALISSTTSRYRATHHKSKETNTTLNVLYLAHAPPLYS